ncbi:MAG TPA: hypothetical protein PLY16_01620, partial [Candidatus Saccharibacteria bacterium]|nr:hypothetical protein [Candidatus Saccharibacteria bacterium]
MRYYEVAPTRIVRSGSHTFTYHSDVQLQIGTVVVIPAGSKEYIGIVISEVKKPSYTTKPIGSAVVKTPIPLPLIKTALWMHTYYSTPLALVLQAFLPSGIQKRRRTTIGVEVSSIRKRTKIVFNKDQVKALADIHKTPSGSIVLQGITGSGKTEIYKEVARQS